MSESVFRIDRFQAQISGRSGRKQHGDPLGKNDAIFWTLNKFGRLADLLVGWAIDHEIGLAKEGRGYVAPAVAELRGSEEYKSAKRFADDHRHEFAGRSIRDEESWPEGVVSARRALINVLEISSLGLPFALAKEVENALIDLSFGKVAPIFEPEANDRKINREEFQLRLSAIGFISFRRSIGYSSEEAHDDVGRAFGRSSDTVRRWRGTLLEEASSSERPTLSLEIRRVVARAKSAAKKYVEAVPSHHGSLARHPGLDDERYGLVALKEVGDKHKAVIGAKKRTVKPERGRAESAERKGPGTTET